jgi:N-dimethylarginine dimethylaminohydrolase
MSHRERLPRNRAYLMCPPEHFAVEYAINPWMDMAEKVRAAGYIPVQVELSELKRGGGSAKCAVAELRPGRAT